MIREMVDWIRGYFVETFVSGADVRMYEFNSFQFIVLTYEQSDDPNHAFCVS